MTAVGRGSTMGATLEERSPYALRAAVSANGRFVPPGSASLNPLGEPLTPLDGQSVWPSEWPNA